jgi:hypothetical protein
LYSEKLTKDFKDKNASNFAPEHLNKLSLTELFTPGVVNFPYDNLNYLDINNLVSSNYLY